MNTKVYSSTLITSTNEITPQSHRKYFGKSICNSMFLNSCTEYEISEIIKDLENGKASDIPIIVIKKCSTLITKHTCGFINNFMECGTFPEILKKGCITPIFKKGDSRFLDNYRPVSTLPIFGKIYEKLIFKRLHSFLSANNIIYENQFGFRKNHSTSHAVNFSVNKILGELENKKHIIGIFIDLSKAFDTISHDKLIDKLNHYGIRGKGLQILRSYLQKRTQQTKYQDTTSDECLVEYGVPQGSVLGPLLFLIYINDLVNCTQQGQFVLFADDTNIFIVGKD